MINRTCPIMAQEILIKKNSEGVRISIYGVKRQCLGGMNTLRRSTSCDCPDPVSLSPPSLSGRTIAVIRTILGIPAESLASEAGLSVYSLSRLEREHRRPALGEVSRLVIALGKLANANAS
jgi:hypothetical protein